MQLGKASCASLCAKVPELVEGRAKQSEPHVIASLKGAAIYCLVLLVVLLAACSDIGDRDNPLDPGAENYAGLIMSSDSFPISSSAAPPSSASDCIGDDCFVDVSSSANGDLFESSSSSSIRNVGNSSSVKSSSSRVSASVLNCGDIWCGSTATDGFSTITATDGTVIGTNWFYCPKNG